MCLAKLDDVGCSATSSRWPTAMLAVGAAVVALLGCSGGNGNPQFEQVSKQFYQAYCAKLVECVGQDAFAIAYPSGQADCVEQNYKEFSSLNTLESVCSQEKWDACEADMRKTQCTPPAGTNTPAGPVIPASCKDC